MRSPKETLLTRTTMTNAPITTAKDPINETLEMTLIAAQIATTIAMMIPMTMTVRTTTTTGVRTNETNKTETEDKEEV